MSNIYNAQLDAYSLYHQQQEEDEHSMNSWALPAIGHALSGSAGTAISNLAIYPLDLIITRLQVQKTLRAENSAASADEYEGVLDAAKKIYNQEGGIKAFYAGVVQDTSKSIVDSFLFFLMYNYLRDRRLSKHGANATTLPALDELAVGMLAGAGSKFFTAPISNIVTRKQTAAMIAARSGSTAKQLTVSDIVQQIKAEKGYQGFWSGYSANLVLTLNPSLTFFLFETFKRVLLPRDRRENPGARLTFLMAAFSKSIASTITYPFSLAKARAQAGTKPPVDPNAATDIKEKATTAAQEKNEEQVRRAGVKAKALAARSTVFTTVFKIYREEGLAALYEGIWGEILKSFFSHGTTMLVKDVIHKIVIKLYLLVLKAIKLPSPADIRTSASETAQKVSDSTVEAVATARNQVGKGLESAGLENVGKVVRGGDGEVTETENIAGDSLADNAMGAYATARNQTGKALQIAGFERVGAAVRGGTLETAPVPNTDMMGDAQGLVATARNQIGKSMEAAGLGGAGQTVRGGDGADDAVKPASLPDVDIQGAAATARNRIGKALEGTGVAGIGKAVRGGDGEVKE